MPRICHRPGAHHIFTLWYAKGLPNQSICTRTELLLKVWSLLLHIAVFPRRISSGALCFRGIHRIKRRWVCCRYRQEFEGIKSPRNLGSYNHTTEGKPAWMAANLPLNTTDADHFDEVCSCFVLSCLVTVAPAGCDVCVGAYQLVSAILLRVDRTAVV